MITRENEIVTKCSKFQECSNGVFGMGMYLRTDDKGWSSSLDISTFYLKRQNFSCALITHHAMKTYGEVPLLTSALDVDEWSDSTPTTLTLRYSLYRRLGEPQNRSGRYGIKNKLFLLSGIEPHSRSFIS
jgi:hypothetical protein